MELDLTKAEMNQGPLVSVIIPCYRQAHYLEEALTSVLAQSYRRFEIIVVDDRSPDNTAEVASRYAGVRLVRLPRNLGLPAARNAGLEASAGDYTVFLDADDRLAPDALEIGARTLAALPECALVYGFCEFVDESGASIPTPPHVLVETDHYRALFKQNHIWTPGAAMFRRSIFSRVAPFDESLVRGCEDIDLYLRIAKHWPIHCHGRVVLQYRKHRASMSVNRFKMLRAENDLFRKHLPEVRGDRELEEFCRSKMMSPYRLFLQRRAVSRIISAVRVRTRLRAARSYLQGVRQKVGQIR